MIFSSLLVEFKIQIKSARNIKENIKIMNTKKIPEAHCGWMVSLYGVRLLLNVENAYKILMIRDRPSMFSEIFRYRLSCSFSGICKSLWCNPVLPRSNGKRP